MLCTATGLPSFKSDEFIKALLKEAQSYQGQAFAQSTLANASTAMRNFAIFCQTTGIYPDPQKGLTDMELVLLITFWARTLDYSTIENYLSVGVRKYHEEMGMPWRQLKYRPAVNAVMRGVRRVKAETKVSKRKLPVTIPLLRRIAKHYDLMTLEGTAHWACILVMFFAMLRKSNVTSKDSKTERHVLRRKDVMQEPQTGMFKLHVKSTKTIQFAEKALEVFLPPVLPNDVLCPTRSMWRYLMATQSRPQDEFLFGYYDQKGEWQTLKYTAVLSKLKAALTAEGLDAEQYAAHSFRRGGATYAFLSGMPDHVIMHLGDWKSPVWHDYVEVQDEMRRRAAIALSQCLKTHPLGAV